MASVSGFLERVIGDVSTKKIPFFSSLFPPTFWKS